MSFASASIVAIAANRFVGFHHQRAFFLLDLNRDDLVFETPGGGGGGCALMALQREMILLVAGDAKLFGDDLGFVAHVDVFEGAPQAVMHDGIDHFGVAHAIAGARLRQQVGRIAHALHATRDECLRIACANGLGRQHHRFQTGAADLVDGKSGDFIGQTGMNGGLPRWSLPDTRGDDVAHDHFIYRVGRDTGTSHGFFDHDCAQLGRGKTGKAA